MGLLGAYLRRLKDERAATLGLFGLLFVTAFAVALGPRLLERLADDALQTELAAAPAFERHTVIYEYARQRAQPPAELAELRQAAQDMAAAFPAEVAQLVEAEVALVETPPWLVLSGTQLDSLLSLRVHEGAFDRLRLVSGRLPGGEVAIVRDERPTALPSQVSNVYEVIVPASAAAAMGLGEEPLGLTVWLGDQLNSGVNLGAVLRVVGTYELIDPDDDFWVTDQAIGGWRLEFFGPTQSFIRTTALLAPEAYHHLVRATHGGGMTLLYQWRFFVDTNRLPAERLPDAVAALRRMEAAMPRSGLSDIPTDTAMSSGLLRMLLRHEASWRSAEVLLGLVALGAVGLALATLAVVASVSSAGRRRVVTLLRARGASLVQLLAMGTAEILVLAVPAILLAVGLAALLVPDTSLLRSVLPSALVALAAGLIVLAIVVRGALSVAGGSPREARGLARLTARRLVLESALVVGALAAAWLLRERGLAATGTAGQVGADPLIAAVPALVGAAAGLLAMRLYPLPTRLLAALMALRRDLLPVLAIRRVVRGGSSALVLLLLVATVSLGVFGSAALVHLERAAFLGSWQDLGADFRLSSATLTMPANLDEAQLPGVEATARASLRSVGTERGSSWLLVVAPAEYERVTRGTPAQVAWPAELTDSASAEAGTDSAPIAAIVGGGLALSRGEVFEVTALPGVARLVASQVRPSFPGVAAGQPFIVVARDQLGAAVGRPPTDNLVFLRAAPEAGGAIARAVEGMQPAVTLDSRAGLEAARSAAPVMGALRLLIGASAILAILYAALAVAAALALAAAEQRDQLAHLRALGLTRRQVVWLSFVEYGPAALAGFLGGVLLGLGLFVFLRPGLGLAAIAGTSVEVPVGLDLAHLALLGLAIMSILVLGWLLAAVVQRDVQPASALRRGIEQ